MHLIQKSIVICVYILFYLRSNFKNIAELFALLVMSFSSRYILPN